MEKYILRWSYWLGLASFAVALVWRGLNSLGIGLPWSLTAGRTIWYMSFYKAGLMFLLVAIATANHAWSNSRRPQ
jgi:hypothetical protein